MRQNSWCFVSLLHRTLKSWLTSWFEAVLLVLQRLCVSHDKCYLIWRGCSHSLLVWVFLWGCTVSTESLCWKLNHNMNILHISPHEFRLKPAELWGFGKKWSWRPNSESCLDYPPPVVGKLRLATVAKGSEVNGHGGEGLNWEGNMLKKSEEFIFWSSDCQVGLFFRFRLPPCGLVTPGPASRRGAPCLASCQLHHVSSHFHTRFPVCWMEPLCGIIYFSTEWALKINMSAIQGGWR